MWFEVIPELLSNHRHPHHSSLPAALTLQQLITLLRSTLNPNQPRERFSADIQATLAELEARGEILVGVGKRYCIAPPMALAQGSDDLFELLFQGDRAYLPLAHKALKTEQAIDSLRLRPKIHGFNRVRDCLAQAGIRLLTVEDTVQHLPYPRPPIAALLRVSVAENPLVSLDSDPALRYVPKQNLSQFERWQAFDHRQISTQNSFSGTLLKLPTGEYFWLADGDFFELDPDTAVLAMFHLDQVLGCPLKLAWDEAQGKLNLQGTLLPGAYAQWLWRLSKPDQDKYRIRYVNSIYRPLVKTAFTRLGCLLV